MQYKFDQSIHFGRSMFEAVAVFVNSVENFFLCRMVATVVEQLGRLDIAINNAGMNKNHAAEDCSASDWDQTFELNTKGVFLCCQVKPTFKLHILTVAFTSYNLYFVVL